MTRQVPMNLWTKSVHDYCIETGRGVTPPEAVERFGTPPGMVTAAELLNAGMRRGFFSREDRRYFAVERKSTSNKGSYFAGIKRVRSVFELGRD